ncbi:hypothetical protein LAZ67_23000042 [Cordylochernes scorpioides]|uniref:Peptidase S1 domain-containing protein n=1 Tax=Cordylochernes scorpioides TaxID=51811 RepID=A0ABY6LRI3_9ARAC|nr:hypothetical protein LAZ67_23000042 [Cordylochernes scorpioides]
MVPARCPPLFILLLLVSAEALRPCHKNSTGQRRSKSLCAGRCGVQPSRSRRPANMMLKIYGGRESKPRVWPWQLAIHNSAGQVYCGATLIAPNWAVTAAHCIQHNFYLRLLEHDTSRPEGREKRARVRAIYVHPVFDPDTVHHDIALIRLNKRFKNITPACLPRPDFRPKRLKEEAVVLGWGKEHTDASFGSNVLKQAKVPVVPLKRCQKAYPFLDLTKGMLCAGYPDGRIDTCAGDSGGPLMTRHKGYWTLQGITSFGEGCGPHGSYGIYTRVAYYVPWIEKVMAAT